MRCDRARCAPACEGAGARAVRLDDTRPQSRAAVLEQEIADKEGEHLAAGIGHDRLLAERAASRGAESRRTLLRPLGADGAKRPTTTMATGRSGIRHTRINSADHVCRHAKRTEVAAGARSDSEDLGVGG
jgi:hypothetical protein